MIVAVPPLAIYAASPTVGKAHSSSTRVSQSPEETTQLQLAATRAGTTSKTKAATMLAKVALRNRTARQLLPWETLPTICLVLKYAISGLWYAFPTRCRGTATPVAGNLHHKKAGALLHRALAAILAKEPTAEVQYDLHCRALGFVKPPPAYGVFQRGRLKTYATDRLKTCPTIFRSGNYFVTSTTALTTPSR